jgi:replicative DNA helicase
MVSNDAIISEINALITSHDNMDYSFWVQHLTSEAPLPADIDFYISRVLRNYNKRRLVEISNATTKRAQGGDTVDSVVSFTRNELDNLECENIGGGPVCFHDVAIDCIDNLQGGSCYEGIPTGYTDIDHYILGLRPSDLIIIAGRPSMGKTTLATNISINAAKSGSIGLIFSLEMSQNRLGLRMLASETGTNLYQLTKGIVADWEKINDVSGNLQNLFIDFSTGLTYQEIVSRIQEFNETHRLDFVMIDYLQKMRFGKADRHDLAVGEATGALKNIAKDLDIPVILLSQLSRANEKDGKVRTPRLSDLRDSGSIEQDADIVLMIHRPEVYSPDVEEYKNMAMVGIMKNRDGETTGIKLTFRKDINRFENYAKE